MVYQTLIHCYKSNVAGTRAPGCGKGSLRSVAAASLAPFKKAATGVLVMHTSRQNKHSQPTTTDWPCPPV